MAANVILILRLVQLIFAIIVLGTIAYVVSLYVSPFSPPSQFNFLLFCAVWTLFPALPYLTLTARYWPTASHKFAILAVEAVTMIFWFAGFIAAAVYINDDLDGCSGSGCSCAKAATVFGAFEWVLFAATTTMAVIHVVHTRHEGGISSDTAKNIQQQYVDSTASNAA